MVRRILWLLPLVLFAAHAFLGYEPDDYRQGYEQAAQDVERVREKLGWASEVDSAILEHVQYVPSLPDKSEQWREGYRQAVQDQFAPKRR